jgi:hypothetical protein
MSQNSVFSSIESGLERELEELCRLEPIFHTEAFGRTAAEFECRMSTDYWEVGASGRRYSRGFILEQVGQIARVNAGSAGWRSSEFGLKRLGPETFLFTYTLDQNGRLTRRSTIWQKSVEGWRVLYHQGTVVSVNEDDTLPS